VIFLQLMAMAHSADYTVVALRGSLDFERICQPKFLVCTWCGVKGRMQDHPMAVSIQRLINHCNLTESFKFSSSQQTPGNPRSSDHGESIPALSIEDEKAPVAINSAPGSKKYVSDVRLGRGRLQYARHQHLTCTCFCSALELAILFVPDTKVVFCTDRIRQHLHRAISQRLYTSGCNTHALVDKDVRKHGARSSGSFRQGRSGAGVLVRCDVRKIESSSISCGAVVYKSLKVGISPCRFCP